MRNKKPPFEITNDMIRMIAEISELIGHVVSTKGLSANPILRRTNRIRTIYGSLAIEQNTLSLEQVTDVLDGKRVLAPPKDIEEVKNAYEIYECMDTLDPCSIDDLLKAHGIMLRGLIKDAGEFREGPAGVVNSKGEIVHFGTLPQYIYGLMEELVEWLKTSDVHPLIKSCVFHYEFELIHPFLDGNGRIGRLWHTLILAKWNPVFAWLPVESMIHDRQQEYYQAINFSNHAAESTEFILFMLSVIKEVLIEVGKTTTVDLKAKELQRWHVVLGFLQMNSHITNADVRKLLDVSQATANRLLAKFTEKGLLEKVHVNGHWAYVLSE